MSNVRVYRSEIEATTPVGAQVRVYRSEIESLAPAAKVRVYRSEIEAGGAATVRVYRSEVEATEALNAFAGVDAIVDALELTTLSAAGSTGPPTTWAWTQTAGPTVTLVGAATAQASFTAPAFPAGTSLTFQVVVGDGVGTDSDTVTVVVLPHNQWWLNGAGTWVPILTRAL